MRVHTILDYWKCLMFYCCHRFYLVVEPHKPPVDLPCSVVHFVRLAHIVLSVQQQKSL